MALHLWEKRGKGREGVQGPRTEPLSCLSHHSGCMCVYVCPHLLSLLCVKTGEWLPENGWEKITWWLRCSQEGLGRHGGSCACFEVVCFGAPCVLLRGGHRYWCPWLDPIPNSSLLCSSISWHHQDLSLWASWGPFQLEPSVLTTMPGYKVPRLGQDRPEGGISTLSKPLLSSWHAKVMLTLWCCSDVFGFGKFGGVLDDMSHCAHNQNAPPCSELPKSPGK